MQFAAVFAGQGSQSSGMLVDLSENVSEVKTTFEEASEFLGRDLWEITNSEDGEQLNQTENTQPAMLAAGVAVWRTWLKQGGCEPVGMAGHSLGEYSALVASGSLDYKDAIKLVSQRAILMQQAVPRGEGAMAAILGLDDDDIVKVCKDVSEQNNGVAEAVNFNSPGQVVIAGDSQTVEMAIKMLSEAGAKRAIKLPVSVPSHCSLMKPAADKLDEMLLATTFNESKYPVIQNVEALSFDTEHEKQSALSKQLHKPVLWVDTVNSLHQNYGADTVIEFSPGKVLFGLNRRINRKLGNLYINDMASLDKALAACDA